MDTVEKNGDEEHRGRTTEGRDARTISPDLLCAPLTEPTTTSTDDAGDRQSTVVAVADSGSDQEPGTAIVFAVAEAKDVAPSTIQRRVDDVVHWDALDKLFEPKTDGTPRDGGQLSFTFAACDVTVLPDRTIRVEYAD